MNGLFANSLYTIHQGQTGRLLSPRLWSRVNGQALMPDGGASAVCIVEDFRAFGKTTAVASNVGRYNGACQYYSYEDTGGTIAQVATNYQGEVAIAIDNTDNDECWMQPGDSASVLGKVSDTAGDDKLLIFEARVKFSGVGDAQNYFVGLSEEGLAAADTISDAGALADKDLLGFWALEGDGDSLKFGYKKSGQTAQTVLSKAISASTYYNLGFIYDPSAPASKRIKVFIDNVEQTTYVDASDIAAATFPDGEELNALFGLKSGGAAAKTLSLDGWAFFQAG
jgi:hypothetical protein